MPKQADEQIENWGVNLGRRSPASGGHFSTPDHNHPTVKPTAMLKDALLDLTNRSDIVVDPFLGSGSTLIAAEKTGRVCRGIKLDPLYIDVIARRYQAATGNPAVLIETGEAFEALGARRSCEAAPARPDLGRGRRP